MRKFSFLATVFFAAVFLFIFAQAGLAGMPEGVKVEVVAEYPSTIPGIAMVKLVKFTFQPGAVLKDFKVPDMGL